MDINVAKKYTMVSERELSLLKDILTDVVDHCNKTIMNIDDDAIYQRCRNILNKIVSYSAKGIIPKDVW